MRSPGIRIALAVSLTLTSVSAEAAQSLARCANHAEVGTVTDRVRTAKKIAPEAFTTSAGRPRWKKPTAAGSSCATKGATAIRPRPVGFTPTTCSSWTKPRAITPRELQNDNSATFYWLRGICWENKNEALVALSDYRTAEKLNPNLDDVQIRLGRLIARRSSKERNRGATAAQDRSLWEQHFANGQRLNPNRAELYLDWGLALSQACKVGATVGEAKAAATALGKKASDVAAPTVQLANDADAAATEADKAIRRRLDAAKAERGSDAKKAGEQDKQAAALKEQAQQVLRWPTTTAAKPSPPPPRPPPPRRPPAMRPSRPRTSARRHWI